MTMTFSSSLSNQLDFEHTLAPLGAAKSRSRRPNRTTKKRQVLDDRQTSYSIMNRDNLLAIMQVPSLSKLITKYTGAGAETSPRLPPVRGGGGGGARRLHEQEEKEEEEEEEIFHDASDIAQLATDLQLTTGAANTNSDEQPQSQSATAARTNTPASSQSRPKGDAWQLECKYTLSEVQQHNSLDDCWMVIFDKVYDTTEFVHEHPGGDFILFEYAGRDATHPFLSSRHGSSAYKMLDKYWIGILVDEELYYSNNSSYCSVYLDLSWRSSPTLEDSNNNTRNAHATSSATSPPNSSSLTSVE